MAPKIGEGTLTIDAQVAEMRALYPSLALVQVTPWIVLWQGTVQPLACEYQIQLLFSFMSLPLASIQTDRVHVEVLSPLVTARGSARCPHLYPNRVFPSRPRLCLHLPHEWDSSMLIALTIVPWTVAWLIAYEGWRATGQWFAGGHGTEREVRP